MPDILNIDEMVQQNRQDYNGNRNEKQEHFLDIRADERLAQWS